jgi:hypothetical protein
VGGERSRSVVGRLQISFVESGMVEKDLPSSMRNISTPKIPAPCRCPTAFSAKTLALSLTPSIPFALNGAMHTRKILSLCIVSTAS